MTTKGEHITAESAHAQSTLPGSSQAGVSANDESAGAKTKRAIDRGAEAQYHCSCQPDSIGDKAKHAIDRGAEAQRSCSSRRREA